MKNSNDKNFTINWKMGLIVLLVLLGLWAQFSNKENPFKPMDYSDFMNLVTTGRVTKVTMEGKNSLKGVTNEGVQFSVYAPNDLWLIQDLLKNKVQVKAQPEPEPSMISNFLYAFGPTLLLLAVYIYFFRGQMGSKGGSPFSFGKSKAKMMESEENTKTFADVAGCDEAKHEVAELVDFLKDPAKFQKLGGRMPKGVLMSGPPGTGKTLLARAVAGEAKVPFFSISGSDFVEMFVGVGAARVRDMFAEAKKHAPCIIFIDEIDAVGRARGAGIGGGNDEREQTLNQMLVEMDGFEASAGIIIMAATNRPDVLDPALLRPGRLDRQVNVGLPDLRGREQILSVHARKVPLSKDVNLKTVARGTPGFSGADLANLINEGALFAARHNKQVVEMSDLEEAKDKLIMGTERASVVMPTSELENTAYHESGHAVIAKVLPGMDPVHKVTIIPRGRALGVTMQLPEKDRFTHNKTQLLNEIAMLFGGRIAEELFTGEISTGASNDFQRATELARRMVSEWGMSDLGVMVYNGEGREGHQQVAEGTRLKADAEIAKILNEQYERAKSILQENADKVKTMTKALLDIETLDMAQIDDIMAGREISEFHESLQVANERREKFGVKELEIDFKELAAN